MTMLANILAEAIAALAELVAYTMTVGSGMMSMNEPEMPKQLLNK